MNAHRSARSTMAPSAGSLFTLRTPAIDASTSCRPKRDRDRDVRDGTSALIRKLPATEKIFSREERHEACYHTSGESPFTRQTAPASPLRRGRIGSGQVLHN